MISIPLQVCSAKLYQKAAPNSRVTSINLIRGLDVDPIGHHETKKTSALRANLHQEFPSLLAHSLRLIVSSSANFSSPSYPSPNSSSPANPRDAAQPSMGRLGLPAVINKPAYDVVVLKSLGRFINSTSDKSHLNMPTTLLRARLSRPLPS